MHSLRHQFTFPHYCSTHAPSYTHQLNYSYKLINLLASTQNFHNSAFLFLPTWPRILLMCTSLIFNGVPTVFSYVVTQQPRLHDCKTVLQSTSHSHDISSLKLSSQVTLLILSPNELTFTWWGCCGLCFWHKPTELAHSFLFCSCVYFCLHGPFNCISFHKFSRQLSIFSFCSSSLISALLILSTVHLFESLLQPWCNS